MVKIGVKVESQGPGSRYGEGSRSGGQGRGQSCGQGRGQGWGVTVGVMIGGGSMSRGQGQW